MIFIVPKSILCYELKSVLKHSYFMVMCEMKSMKNTDLEEEISVLLNLHTRIKFEK